jgi:hypothetical protein
LRQLGYGLWILRLYSKDSITADQTTRKRRKAQDPSQIQIGERSGRFCINFVKQESQKEAKKISLSFHHLQVQKELVDLENKVLREALQVKKKHKNKGRSLIFNSIRSIMVGLCSGHQARSGRPMPVRL